MITDHGLHWTGWMIGWGLLMSMTAFGQADKQDPAAAPPDSRPKLSVLNFYCPTEKVATGGQPSLSALDEAAAQGYKAVINLRTETEKVDLKAEAEKVRALGMKYVHIPVNTQEPKPSDAEAFLRAVREADNYPMFIHCGSANRVGAFWMIHRVLDDHWDVERAEKEAQQIGLRSPQLKEFARKYIESQKKK